MNAPGEKTVRKTSAAWRSARAAATRGERVFPLHHPVSDKCSCGDAGCANVAKHPRIAGWPLRATDDLVVLRAWERKFPGANIGNVTGPGTFIALDVDGPAGRGTLETLEGKFGKLPPTCTVITGRRDGGYQLRFRSKRPIRNSESVLGPNLDVRGDRGYVVNIGSVHQSGKVYAWKKGFSPTDRDYADLPPAWEDLLENPGRAASSRPAIPDVTRRRFRKNEGELLLQKAIVRTKPGNANRDDTCLWLTCQLRDAGASIDEAKPYVLKYQKTVERWKGATHLFEKEVALEKLRRVFSMAPRPPRAAPLDTSAQGRGEVLEKSGAEPGTLVPELLGIDEYLSAGDPTKGNAESLIGDGILVRKSLNILAGTGGVGKTILATQMGLSLATGEEFLGLKIPKPVPVVYLLAEGNNAHFRKRLQKIRNRFGGLKQAFKIIPEDATPPEIGSGGFERLAAANPEAVIFLDTQGHFHSINDIDRPSWKHGVVKKLASLQREFGVTFVLIDHLNKMKTQKGKKLSYRELLTGAGNKRDDAYTLLFLDWPNGEFDPVRTLIFDKLRNAAPRRDLSLTVNLDEGFFTVSEEGVLPTKENQNLRLVTDLVTKLVGNSKTKTAETGAIVRTFQRQGFSRRTAEEAIRAADQEKKIIRVKKGHYRPTHEEPER